MPGVVPRGNPNASRIEVSDDSLEYWKSVGYVLVEDEKKAPAKKSTAKRSSGKSK